MVLFRHFLLIYWSVLALLGHAGTHALADCLGVCCHVQTQAGRDAHLSGKSAGHADCQHCLQHRRSQSEAAEKAAGSEDCGGESDGHSRHDAANCRLCDWFLKFTPQGLSAEPCVQPLPTVTFVVSVSVSAVSAAVPPTRSRGPPILLVA